MIMALSVGVTLRKLHSAHSHSINSGPLTWNLLCHDPHPSFVRTVLLHVNVAFAPSLPKILQALIGIYFV
jgi:hypothetical protein